MKRLVKVLIVGGLSGLILSGCEKDNNIKQGEITGTVLSVSDCKSGLKSSPVQTSTPDSLSCVEYEFISDSGILRMKHINAGFNCCPGKIGCKVSLSGDTILVRESETSSMCDCDCLFDLDIEITGILEKSYLVRFIEPYVSSQESLVFGISLKESALGTYCVTRKRYPWGTNIF